MYNELNVADGSSPLMREVSVDDAKVALWSVSCLEATPPPREHLSIGCFFLFSFILIVTYGKIKLRNMIPGF